MAMPQQGMSTDEVFARLDEYRQDDLPVKGGRAWGFVYDAGPEVDAVKQRAVVTYLGKNGLDPTVFPSLERLENDILAIARDHLNGGEEVVGTFTSGGTESCMLAELCITTLYVQIFLDLHADRISKYHFVDHVFHIV